MYRPLVSARYAAMACVLASAPASPALADLNADVAALKSGLERDGALVHEVEPVFLEAGAVTIVEPLALVSSQDACVTVVVMSPRTISFDVVGGSLEETVDEALSHARADKD